MDPKRKAALTTALTDLLIIASQDLDPQDCIGDQLLDRLNALIDLIGIGPATPEGLVESTVSLFLD